MDMTDDHSMRNAFPPYTKRLFMGGLILGLIPIFVLIAAFANYDAKLLHFVHVITGGSWTGIDIFMGVIMTRVLSSLEPQNRAEFLKRLVPANLFFMPAMSSVAVTSGIYLAQWTGIFNLNSPFIISSGIVVVILLIQGFGIFFPNSIRVFLELNKSKPDRSKIIRLSMRNLRLAGVQAILQVLLISIMTGYYIMF